MRRVHVILAVACIAGCLAPPEAPPEAVTRPPPPPPPPPPPGGGGGGGGVPPPPVQFVCGGTAVLDSGNHGAFAGSGLKSDGGTSELWFVRTDRGLANIAAPVAHLVTGTSQALTAAKLGIRSIAIISLYNGDVIWSWSGSTFPIDVTPLFNGMVTRLQSRASLDLSAPAGCATAMLLDVGKRLFSLGVFSALPGALMVGVVDHGARPVGIDTCGDPGAALGANPACWANFGGTVLPRIQTRFAFFATPETVSTSDIRTSCLSVPGIPLQSIDVLEASSAAFFDPLSNEMDVAQPGLATRFEVFTKWGKGTGDANNPFAPVSFQPANPSNGQMDVGLNKNNKYSARSESDSVGKFVKQKATYKITYGS